MLYYFMQDVSSIVCFHHGLSVDPLGGLQPVVQLESTLEVINRWSTRLPPQGISAETPGPQYSVASVLLCTAQLPCWLINGAHVLPSNQNTKPGRV